ncbi:MAG: guanylate kinase [Bacteroidales bacterium]|nr:guanylate kinase [Bacteroidales bacterium]
MQSKLIVVSAPSGAGKTSIVRYLLEQNPKLSFSVSATTRAKREMEVDGKDYYFIPVPEFQKRIENGAFLEWQEVYKGQYYGSLKSEVDRLGAEGKVVIFDVDVLGGINIKKFYGERALSIFIQPPTVEELKKRLLGRGTETPESLKKRVDKAEYELTFANQFDVVVVNDDLETARHEADNLIKEFLCQK